MGLKTLAVHVNMRHVTETNLVYKLLWQQFCKYIEEYY